MSVRAGRLLVFAVPLAGWLFAASAAPQPSTASAQSTKPQPTEQAKSDQVRRAAEEGDRGEIANADRLLRGVLSYDPDHAGAASILRSLYERPGIELPVDQKQLDEALTQLGEGFARTDTEHFVVLSNVGRQWTTSKVQLLERAYRQFFRFMERLGAEAVPPRAKLLCILIDDHDAYASFARTNDGVMASWVAGYYASVSNRVVFYNDATGPGFESADRTLADYEKLAREADTAAIAARRAKQNDRAKELSKKADQLRSMVAAERQRLSLQARQSTEAKTIHEAIHLIAFNCGLQSRSHQFPFWLTEGLAASFETENATGSFGPDFDFPRRDVELKRAIKDGAVVPLEVFVQLNGIVNDAQQAEAWADTAEARYAQARGLFRYLFKYERESLAGYIRDIWKRPGGQVRPEEHLAMFRARFGEPDDIERRWLASLKP